MLKAANLEEDALYAKVVEFALEQGRPLSITRIQRQFHIGLNWAARFVVRMEQEGIIKLQGHANGAQVRHRTGIAGLFSVFKSWLYRRP